MERKLPIAVTAALLLISSAASADIWLCISPQDRQSIQDKPCGKGFRTKSHVPDAARSAAPPGRTATAAPVSKTRIDVGLQRNKTVICNLLDTEKAEALTQISGSSTAPPGENPSDNLVKIEKQRTRVGCDAG